MEYSVCVHYEPLQHLHVREYSMQSHDLQPTVCFIIEFTDNYVQLEHRRVYFAKPRWVKSEFDLESQG